MYNVVKELKQSTFNLDLLRVRFNVTVVLSAVTFVLQFMG